MGPSPLVWLINFNGLWAQGAVWMVIVVIFAPLIGQYSHLSDNKGQIGIQHVVTEGPVKALNKPVLRWFTWLYVLDGDIMFGTE